jgi:hypothetical protein
LVSYTLFSPFFTFQRTARGPPERAGNFYYYQLTFS